MAIYKIVNEKGLQEIHAILSQRHKLGGDHFGKEELSAWASEVERSMSEGNGPQFEIRAADTVSGHTEVQRLSFDAVEWSGDTTKAMAFIESIASNMPEVNKSLKVIQNVLEDGDALLHLGATDDDVEMIEDAHSIVSEWIWSGFTNLSDAK